MGLILDSSVLIAAERTGKSARQVLEEIASVVPRENIALSVISVLELAHGVARAASPERKAARTRFLTLLTHAIPVYPVSNAIALHAGRLDGESTARGQRLALADLLIGVTALNLNYRVATRNTRHFERIPGLELISL